MILPWELNGCFPYFVEEMERVLRTPLSQQFPTLEFAKRADGWLKSIKDKSIEEQFKERRIVKIQVTFLFSAEGFLSLNGNRDGIFVLIDSESKEKLQTLAHEIGHTFHLDLEKTKIENTIPNRWEYNFDNPEDYRLYSLVEKFADTFGEKWLAVNGKSKIEEWRHRRNKEIQLQEQR